MQPIGRVRKLFAGVAVLTFAVVLVIILLQLYKPNVSNDVRLPDTPEPSLTTPNNSWREVIQQQLVTEITAVPTVSIPLPRIDPPTSTPANIVWQATPTPTRFVPDSRPTRAAPTAVGSPVGPEVRRMNDPRRGEFSPPPAQVPLSLDPRDHFYFKRPVDSSANSSEIFWYVYGSDGPQNDWRVHHGVDLPNPIGKEVLASGPGMVIWAGDNYIWYENGRRIESAYTYGNVVIIEHDFGYQGQRLFTLYAHLQAIFVQAGETVKTGHILGLSGRSGVVSGPHVHFEVRVGQNSYYVTRNPVLWMAPYENHGVVAGRILYPNGQPVQDVTVTLLRNGRVWDTTTTYVNPHRPEMTCNRCWNVNPDDVWRENFVIGDVPAGEYTISVTVNGVRTVRQITVRAATTVFVDFSAPEVVSEPTPAG